MINYGTMCRFVNLSVLREFRYYTVCYLPTIPRILACQFGSYVTSLSCVFICFVGNLSSGKSGEHTGSISFCFSTALKLIQQKKSL